MPAEGHQQAGPAGAARFAGRAMPRDGRDRRGRSCCWTRGRGIKERRRAPRTAAMSTCSPAHRAVPRHARPGRHQAGDASEPGAASCSSCGTPEPQAVKAYCLLRAIRAVHPQAAALKGRLGSGHPGRPPGPVVALPAAAGEALHSSPGRNTSRTPRRAHLDRGRGCAAASRRLRRGGLRRKRRGLGGPGWFTSTIYDETGTRSQPGGPRCGKLMHRMVDATIMRRRDDHYATRPAAIAIDRGDHRRGSARPTSTVDGTRWHADRTWGRAKARCRDHAVYLGLRGCSGDGTRTRTVSLEERAQPTAMPKRLRSRPTQSRLVPARGRWVPRLLAHGSPIAALHQDLVRDGG